MTIGGVEVNGTLEGVVDTTALQYSLIAWAEGEIAHAGRNQNFPHPVSRIPTTSLEDFWDTYFEKCRHFDLKMVRMGASDSWGTEVLFSTWMDHRQEFYRVLNTMSEKAAAHGVYVVLVLAGTQDYPAYDFRGPGDPFNTSSPAYSNYLAYVRDVMTMLASQDGIGIYDLWNEPDADKVDQGFWKGDKVAFSTWATQVALDTSAFAYHPRTMGVAGLGQLFGWGQEDFDLATGKVPFEVAHRHYYASDHAPSSAFEPELWAANNGKPLLWGEVGYNGQLAHTRWPQMEELIKEHGGDAVCSITLTGTEGYPHHSSAVSWIMWSVAVPVSVSLTPLVYPTVHPMDESVSAVAGGSWPIVLFFAATWLGGYVLVYRGRNLLFLPFVVTLLIVTVLVFISRV